MAHARSLGGCRVPHTSTGSGCPTRTLGCPMCSYIHDDLCRMSSANCRYAVDAEFGANTGA